MNPFTTSRFDNSYASLPASFYSPQKPSPVAKPELIRLNDALARQLGIDTHWLASPEGLSVLAGNDQATGSEPIATVYAGHQFGGWNPRLGDGRAVLLGEVIDSRGDRYDLQLKGSGRTPYSRGGDGRSPLGPVLREYIVSEAMAALGVPTTRSLAAVATGEQVVRETLLPGGILTRVASSHIRIGTFQYFWARGELDNVRLLADHVIGRHYPDAARAERPYLALLQGVVDRQARLIAQWQQLGFIHGVMNTDNMLLSGETIDYGPCAFMDDYHPNTVYSSIDRQGRYAYANQPAIGQWNLAWLGQALLPLIDEDETAAIEAAQQAISAFKNVYEQAYDEGMHQKLGLERRDSANRALIDELLETMAAVGADFTLTFRRLAELAGGEPDGQSAVSALLELPEPILAWSGKWRMRLDQLDATPAQQQRQMLAINPAFIPRNHLVEEVIRAAVDADDFQPFHRLVDRLAEPYRYDTADARYALPPRPEQIVSRTFCGT